MMVESKRVLESYYIYYLFSM